MGVNLALVTEQKSPPSDHSWLKSAHATQTCDSITLDGDAFAADLTNWADGIVPAGTVLGEDASSGLYAPYDPDEANTAANEVQTLTIDATGGDFDLTVPATDEPGWDAAVAAAGSDPLPQTVSAIAFDAAAATIQTALEAILGAGNVTVTGSAGGPYTITFLGDLAQTNAPLLDSSVDALTGGAGTAVVTVGTAGGSGAGTAVGFLFQAVDLGTTTENDTVGHISAALLWHGEIDESKIPATTGRGGLDSTAKTDLAKRFRFA